MRTVYLSAVAIVATLAACSNNDAQPDTGEVSFALEGDGHQVYLNGSPRDPSYKAAYPLANVDHVVVTVKKSGRLDAMCTRGGVTKPCDDTPFFAKIARSGTSCAGVHTRVFDLRGQLVANVHYAQYMPDTGTHDFDPNGTTRDGTPGATNDGTGGGSVGGSLGKAVGGTSDGNGSSTSDGTNGTGSSSGGSGGFGSSGGTNDGTGGTGSSGGTNDGCTVLSACCPSLNGGLNTGCVQTAATRVADACTALLGAYKSMGYCGVTHDGGSSSGGSSGGSTSTGSSGGSGTRGSSGGTNDGHNGTSGGMSGKGGAANGGGGGTEDGDDDDCGGPNGGLGGPGSNGGASGGQGGFGGSGMSSGAAGTSSGASSDGSNGASSSGSSSGGTADCTQSDYAQARAQFCAGINQWLQQHHLNMTIDCGQLDSTSFDAGAAYSQTAADNSCTDIMSDSWWKAHDLLVWTDKCGASAEITLANWKEEARYQLKNDGACRHSPLVLDLDGNGVALSSLEQGVSFDLLATGKKVHSAWIGAGDALLAIDWNKDGTLDGARELFGQSSFGRGYDDGFAALRELDANGDGVVDAKDPAFTELLAWRDGDRDGVSRPTELTPLVDLGISALAVMPEKAADSFDPYGNEIPLVSTFTRDDRTRSALVDAFFRFKP